MLNQNTLRNHRITTRAAIKAIDNANIETLCFCDETATLYKYDPTSGATANDTYVLITGTGGTTRWIGIAGKYVAVSLPKKAINNQSGTAYAFVLGDKDKYTRLSDPDPIAATLPPDVFAIEDEVEGAQVGIGQVTLVEGPGVTINGPKKVSAQWKGWFLKCVALNVWDVHGGLEE